MDRKLIAVDFDGTVVSHEYPAVGEPLALAHRVLWRLHEQGHKIILWTCRTGQKLEAAQCAWSEMNLPPLHGVNRNDPDDPFGNDGIKVFADVYIDDRALCAPIHPTREFGGIDWLRVELELEAKGFLPPLWQGDNAYRVRTIQGGD